MSFLYILKFKKGETKYECHHETINHTRPKGMTLEANNNKERKKKGCGGH